MGNEAKFRQSITQAMRAGATGRLIERFGRPIVEGGQYTVSHPYPPVFKVTRIESVLDPSLNLPPGVSKVTMHGDFTLFLQGGVPTEAFTLISMPQAQQPADTQTTDNQETTDGQDATRGIRDDQTAPTGEPPDAPGSGRGITLTDGAPRREDPPAGA